MNPLSICDECSCQVEPGEFCYKLQITEITADGYPYLPNVREIAQYPFRIFCDIKCLHEYVMREHVTSQEDASDIFEEGESLEY